ncbi:Protein kinase domain-containing protein [Cinnamomum micranthum f. kanehirae]|uniref:Receptor-like serine/threonine-protein kinase n=1 Tax=Cinnamomum micranthum f. kanehirae TaxID=337451 RepID=A0A443NH25_9MAGN|nr:Protein kinase domain-containing protein [Cinnamomum micranthum f. kanehirae]
MSSRSNLLSLFLALLPLSSIARTSNNISLGTSLSSADENAPWVLSPNGDFAFGFYRLLDKKDLFLLAIWYAQIPQRTVIWSANGDNPVQKGSKVELTSDGELVLNDHQGQEIWKPSPQAVNASNGRVTSAAMLDTGNFVLKGSLNISYFWQTFNEPTDTILPTQVLEFSGKLSSRLTESSFSNGRFQLRLLNDGNLVLNTVGFPTERANDAYYVSNTYGSGFRVLFNESGYISILRRDGTPLNIMQTSTGSPMDFYYRATLDFDGVFRQYRYPRTKQRNGETAENWSIISSIPRPTEICRVTPSKVGSGICGFNSYCRVGVKEERHTCECPDGYSFFDPNDKYKGCKQDHAVELRQACDLDKQRMSNMFEMTPHSDIDWPLSDSELLTPYDEAQCSIACLEDCLCAVAITRNENCWKKKLPLSNGRMDTSLGGKALIKVLKQDGTQAGKRKKDQGSLILAGSFLLGCSAFLNFLFLLGIPLCIHFSYHKKLLKAQPDSSMLAMNLRSFTYMELEEMTDGFKEELGRGAFATVYKGTLTTDQIIPVAVKKLEKMGIEDDEKGFKAELNTIGRTHHKNLVRLLGFCDQGPQKLLVYEFMSNGSLAGFLFGGLRPRWEQRMRIASEIARGLMYLHEECSSQIIHCDVKPQNILLGDCFTARISDFGMAKLLKTDHSRTRTAIRGTRGYFAPEWFKSMMITAKVDVYSFGVMLLEIICCRKNIVLEQQNYEEAILTVWAYDCYKNGRLDTLVDHEEEALNDARKLNRLVMVAIWCIQEEPSLRPSMKKVTEMIEGAVEVAVPPDPSSFISKLV